MLAKTGSHACVLVAQAECVWEGMVGSGDWGEQVWILHGLKGDRYLESRCLSWWIGRQVTLRGNRSPGHTKLSIITIYFHVALTAFVSTVSTSASTLSYTSRTGVKSTTGDSCSQVWVLPLEMRSNPFETTPLYPQTLVSLSIL